MSVTMWRRAAVVALALALLVAPSRATGVRDAEGRAHEESAARLEEVATHEYPGFRVLQLKLSVLSAYSYIISSRGEAIVVDPVRDVDGYLDLLKREQLKLAAVFLTHNHADFVAGHVELARRTSCPVLISAQAGAGFPHEPLADGATRTLGDARLSFLATPGHTPESMCLLAGATPGRPLCIFTGDTLFIGSVGRPDLLTGTVRAAALARAMFESWTRKLALLPDDSRVFPGHGAGSLCGAHLSDQPSATLGEQRVTNAVLRHRAENDFIAAILNELPAAPAYFAHDAALNRAGPEPVDWNAATPEAEPVEALADHARHWVVDVRDAKRYAAGHVPGALNVGLRGRFETWVGMLVPWDAKLVLVGETDELATAVRRLHRVGYRVTGTLTPERWRAAGRTIATSRLVAPRALHAAMHAGSAPLLVDVRLPEEWMGQRIGTAVNLPLDRLGVLSKKLDPAVPVIAVCNSAFRSSLAVGILEREGFRDVGSMDGGSQAWIDAGLPAVTPVAGAAAAVAAPVRAIKLPARVDAAELRRMMLDLPGAFELVDLRPAAAFADYAIPGSRRADVDAVLDDPSYLAGTAPLVLVCRDGTVSMAVAGALVQKTQRPIRVLYGGVEAYWSGASPVAPGASPPAAPPVAPRPAPAPPARKRSAGC